MTEFEQVLARYIDGKIHVGELRRALARALDSTPHSVSAALRALSEAHKAGLPHDVYTALRVEVGFRAVLGRAPGHSSPAGKIEHQRTGIGPGFLLGDRYLLVEELPAIGIGMLWRGCDLLKVEAGDKSPTVAVKLLDADLLRRAGFHSASEAFEALGRKLGSKARLVHPNLATCYDGDLDTDTGTVYLTMELLVGHSLDETFCDLPVGGLAVEDVMVMVTQIGAGLAYAHRDGWAHGNLNPRNCFVTESGAIKLLDPYLSDLLPRLDTVDPQYAAPDVSDGKTPDPRDDIFALGVMTYQLLSGVHPYARTSTTHARDKGHTLAAVDKLDQRGNLTLARALALEHSARMPDVDSFLAGLQPRKGAGQRSSEAQKTNGNASQGTADTPLTAQDRDVVAHLRAKLFALFLLIPVSLIMIHRGLDNGRLWQDVDFDAPLTFTVTRTENLGGVVFFADFRALGHLHGSAVPHHVDVPKRVYEALGPGSTIQVFRTGQPQTPLVFANFDLERSLMRLGGLVFTLELPVGIALVSLGLFGGLATVRPSLARRLFAISGPTPRWYAHMIAVAILVATSWVGGAMVDDGLRDGRLAAGVNQSKTLTMTVTRLWDDNHGKIPPRFKAEGRIGDDAAITVVDVKRGQFEVLAPFSALPLYATGDRDIPYLTVSRYEHIEPWFTVAGVAASWESLIGLFILGSGVALSFSILRTR